MRKILSHSSRNWQEGKEKKKQNGKGKKNEGKLDKKKWKLIETLEFSLESFAIESFRKKRDTQSKSLWYTRVS